MIDPKIETMLVKSKQNYFKVIKTLKGQKHQSLNKISKVHIENEDQSSNHKSNGPLIRNPNWLI